MIKAVIYGETPTLILGITRENIDRMLDNKPLVVDTAKLDLPKINIIIIAGETYEDVREDLRSIGVISAN